MNVEVEQVVTSTDVQKKFNSISKLTKEKKEIVVLKHNKPDIVILDFDYYCMLMEISEKLKESKDNNKNNIK